MSSGDNGNSANLELILKPGNTVPRGPPTPGSAVKASCLTTSNQHQHHNSSHSSSCQNGHSRAKDSTDSHGHIPRYRTHTTASKDSGVSLNSSIADVTAGPDVSSVHPKPAANSHAAAADSASQGQGRGLCVVQGRSEVLDNKLSGRTTEEKNICYDDIGDCAINRTEIRTRNSAKDIINEGEIGHSAIARGVAGSNGRDVEKDSIAIDQNGISELFVKNLSRFNKEFPVISEKLDDDDDSHFRNFGEEVSLLAALPEACTNKNNNNDDDDGNDVNADEFHTFAAQKRDEVKQKPDEVKKQEHQDAWRPPDGGFGWMVVFSSFTISMLVDGVCFSFGMFVEDFKEVFDADNSTVSWIGSVLNGTYMFVGPLVGALCNVFGCRRVAFSGSLVAATAICFSTFSPNIIVLIFTFGLLGGFGFGLMYLPAIVMVGYYFEKRRALATGLACCGSGMGAFLFAPLSQVLLDKFSWQGALMILSGLVLHGTFFSLFYRPLPMRAAGEAEVEPGLSDVTVTSERKPPRSRVELNATVDLDLQESETGDREGARRTVSMSDVGRKDKRMCKSSTALLHLFKRSPQCMSKEYHGREARPRRHLSRLAASTDFSATCSNGTKTTFSWLYCPGDNSSDDPSLAFMQPLMRKDIFYSGSLSKITIREASSSESTEFTQVVNTTHDTSSQLQPDRQTEKRKKVQGKWAASFSSIFDITLLKSPTFMLYLFSCFLCMAGFFVPFIYMPIHAKAKGVNQSEAAFLISIIGITNIVSRVAVGFISDQPWADSLLINSLALIMGGLATAAVPFFQHYWTFCIYSAVFGCSIAVFVSLRSIIMVELMGLEKLTTAFGFVIMGQGGSSFIGAPIAGWVSDMTGSYDYAFYMAGGIFILSGVICLPLRRIARWEGLLRKAH